MQIALILASDTLIYLSAADVCRCKQNVNFEFFSVNECYLLEELLYLRIMRPHIDSPFALAALCMRYGQLSRGVIQ